MRYKRGSSSTGMEFMEKTKYQHLEAADQRRGVSPPPLEQSVPEGKQVSPLPDACQVQVSPKDLTAAIVERRSVRRYAEEPLTLDELAYLLWCTQGVVKQGRASTLRNVPSAGARHPLETYVLANRVTDLQPGLYRYVALSHGLVDVDLSPGAAEKVMQGLLGQEMVITSAATFVWTAVPYRCSWRYGERAYRYIHLDAGHVCQNMYLAALAIGAQCCAMAAFDDDFLNAVLGVDGESEFAIYAAAVGKGEGREA